MVRMSSAGAHLRRTAYKRPFGRTRGVTRVTLITAALTLLVPTFLRADPVLDAAVVLGPRVTFPFTVYVTSAFGPLDILFGRSFAEGDALSGRLIFDGTSGPDQDPWAAHGMYAVPSARLELDVPSGFALDAGSVDRFNAETIDNLPGMHDEMIFYAFTCCHSTGTGFVSVDVLWTDPRNEALSSDALPSDPRALGRFRRVAFGLLAHDDPDLRIALFGESALTPVPEPATLMMVACGCAAALRSRSRRGARSRRAESST